jgi:hypothetical protein
MQTSTLRWTESSGWSGDGGRPDSQFVLVFGEHRHLRDAACFEELRARFPSAHLFGCSSAGTVHGAEITDADVVAVAVRLDRARVRLVARSVEPGDDAASVARELVSQLAAPDLRHALVLCDGLTINGTQLALGLSASGVPVTGGLAGDADRFQSTWVMADAPASRNCVALLGIYGDVSVRSTYCTGWTEFGAERRVTRSAGKVVHEIDGQPALSLYKRYLGDLATTLPASGMRFPLSIVTQDGGHTLTRTLLAVDEAEQSLTFAGDVPQGSRCRLMRTNLDRLVESADEAAGDPSLAGDGEGLALIFSCVGRRIVLGQMAEEELEAVERRMGPRVRLAGFYSYGEIAPIHGFLACDLHNQTMCLTVIRE